MSCFDSVLVKCPICSELLEFQTKAGACAMRMFNIYSVPTEIAKGLDDETYGPEFETCKCGQKWYIKIKPNQVLNVEMELVKDEDLKILDI